MNKLHLQIIGISLFMVFVVITIPSAFATTHYENFAQFYTNQTVFKGDAIIVNNTDTQSYQVDADGFGSGSIGQYGTFTHVFNTVGQIGIMDDLHRGVLAFVTVLDPTIQPVIYTNSTTYKQGGMVDIYGSGLIPITHQSVTIYDSNGQISQVLQTPIIQDRSMFLPFIIPALGSLGEWKIVIIQNGQVITNSFTVTQGLIKAQNNDTVVSSPVVVLNNNTSVSQNNTVSNSTISQIQTPQIQTTQPDNSQQIQALSDKIDALNSKIDSLSTQQLSLFGLVTKLAHFFGLN
jgi:hypothetical protein